MCTGSKSKSPAPESTQAQLESAPTAHSFIHFICGSQEFTEPHKANTCSIQFQMTSRCARQTHYGYRGRSRGWEAHAEAGDAVWGKKQWLRTELSRAAAQRKLAWGRKGNGKTKGIKRVQSSSYFLCRVPNKAWEEATGTFNSLTLDMCVSNIWLIRLMTEPPLL